MLWNRAIQLIRVVGMNGIVLETEHLADFLEQFWLLTFPRARHERSSLRCLRIVESRSRATLLENLVDIILSGQNGMITNG